MTQYLTVEWVIAVPDTADMALLRSQAEVITPNSKTGFHGHHDIVTRFAVTSDTDYPDEEVGYGTPS